MNHDPTNMITPKMAFIADEYIDDDEEVELRWSMTMTLQMMKTLMMRRWS